MMFHGLVTLLLSLNVFNSAAHAACTVCTRAQDVEKMIAAVEKEQEPVAIASAAQAMVEKAAGIVSDVLKAPKLNPENTRAMLKLVLKVIPHDIEMYIPGFAHSLFKKHYNSSDKTLKTVLADMIKTKELSKGDEKKLLDYFGIN